MQSAQVQNNIALTAKHDDAIQNAMPKINNSEADQALNRNNDFSQITQKKGYTKTVLTILLALTSLGILYISTLLFAILLLWFLPTICSIFLNFKKKSTFITNIACFNCLGAAPFACILIKNKDINNHIQFLLEESHSIIHIYAIVAIGIAIYLMIPRYVVLLENAKVLQKISETEKELQALHTEWNFKKN